MKKILSLLIVCIICCSMIVPASAEAFTTTSQIVSNEVCQDISSELTYYENNQSIIGLSNVDFSNLKLSGKINVYECISTTGFSILSEAYFLYEDEEIVTLAYKVEDGLYQFMTGLAEKIKALNCQKIAIVYDDANCYVHDGDEFFNIYTSPEIDVTRCDLSEIDLVESPDLELCNLGRKQDLGYTSAGNLTRAVQQNYFCTVNYVTQNPYENICWAACTAMVSNTIKGTNLDAVDVAMAHYGADFNYVVTATVLQNIMNNTYGLNYTYRSSIPSDNVILDNIQNSTPIVGRFNAHAVIIYGMNIMAGRIMIIDPTFGSTTCYIDSNGNYYYIHSGTGNTMTMNGALCRSW